MLGALNNVETVDPSALRNTIERLDVYANLVPSGDQARGPELHPSSLSFTSPILLSYTVQIPCVSPPEPWALIKEIKFPEGTGVAVGVGVGVGVAVAPGIGVGVGPAGVGVGVGTAVAAGTGVGVGTITSGTVIDAVIDHDCPLAKIVPVFPLSELTPPNITVDPATVGYAVTVIVEFWSYLPDASGAGLKTNCPLDISKTV